MTSLREALRSSALVRDTRPSLENVIYAIYGADRKKTSLVFNCLTIDDRNSPLSSRSRMPGTRAFNMSSMESMCAKSDGYVL